MMEDEDTNELLLSQLKASTIWQNGTDDDIDDDDNDNNKFDYSFESNLSLDDDDLLEPFPSNTTLLLEPFPSKNRKDKILEPFPTKDDEETAEESTSSSLDGRIENLERTTTPILCAGDHIFVWRSYGVPRAYQSHAIVLSVGSDPTDEESIRLVSFYHRSSSPYNDDKSNNKRMNWRRPLSNAFGYSKDTYDDNEDDDDDGCFLDDDDYYDDNGGGTHASLLNENETACSAGAVQEESLASFRRAGSGNHDDIEDDGSSGVFGRIGKKRRSATTVVRHVEYGSGWSRRLLSRGGTCTACCPDERGLVVARAKYLLENPGVLPEFHLMASNGECAAVWCRLGRWCTLQASTMLGIIAVGQVGGAALGGMIASNLTVFIPAHGWLGAYGFVWAVPATVAFPVLIPLFVTIGLASLVPLGMLWRFRRQWGHTSLVLNREFWTCADDDVQKTYFAQSHDSNEDWIRNFFGISTNSNDDDEAQTSTAQQSKYMPLADDDDNDSTPKKQERRNYFKGLSKTLRTGYRDNPQPISSLRRILSTGSIEEVLNPRSPSFVKGLSTVRNTFRRQQPAQSRRSMEIIGLMTDILKEDEKE